MGVSRNELESPMMLDVVPLSVFAGRLLEISRGIVTKAVVSDYLMRHQPDPSDLDTYIHWSPEKHTRNLIFRNDMMELMLICWNIGNITPLHTHNGQLGWMSMARGRLLVENFRLRACNRPENQEVVGMDCLAGATQIDMEALATELVVPGSAVNTVDKHQTIHRISNLAEWNEPAVSLHIYSRPIDSCVVFDVEGSRCFRRDLSYDFVGPEL